MRAWLLAQRVDEPAEDPFLDLLFGEGWRPVMVVIFVVLAVLVVRAYRRRRRPADMEDGGEE